MIPLRLRTHYTIGLGFCKNKQIVEQVKKHGYNTVAITDLNSLSGSVEFNEEISSESIKPIMGIELTTVENGGTLLILAKNRAGWSELIKLASVSNTPELYKDGPRISFGNLPNNGNLICITGYSDSYAATAIFSEDINNYNTIEEVQSKLKITCVQDSIDITNKLKDIFGHQNVFIGISIDGTPLTKVATEIYRKVAKESNTTVIALPEIYYASETDYIDHYILLCSSLKITIDEIHKCKTSESKFFKPGNQCYFIKSEQQLLDFGYTQQELDNTNQVGNMCETYKLSNPHLLPNYEWTEGMSQIDYIKYLCRLGWKKKHKSDWDKTVYGDRVKYELDVIERNNLAGYFLIVQDFINWAKNEKILVSVGRGSSCGSLVSYLLNITEMDSIKHKLSFERFFNEGRKGNLPDIDTDFPVNHRERVINYIKMRYGHDRVAKMATYGKLQGRGALKEVMRIHNTADFGIINEVTELLPQREEISDQLEETGEESIIMWTLKNEPDRVEQYCKYIDGKFSGQFAQSFAQAARIEGTIKSQGQHAAGVIISPVDLKDLCPIFYDDNGNMVTALDMDNAKILGLVKMDILGTAILDKLMGVNNLLRYGRINV